MEPISWPNALKSILLATLIAGTLDAAAAVAILGKFNYIRVFQFIASGAFGPAAFTGGSEMVWAGVGFHYFITACFSGFYILLYQSFPVLRRLHLAGGALYGVFIWLIMNLLLLPRTHVAQAPVTAKSTFLNIGILILMIGVPIAYITHLFFSTEENE